MIYFSKTRLILYKNQSYRLCTTLHYIYIFFSICVYICVWVDTGKANFSELKNQTKIAPKKIGLFGFIIYYTSHSGEFVTTIMRLYGVCRHDRY